MGASFAGDVDYNASAGSAGLTVGKATPTITWANPAGITYGTALGATQLNATASVPGSFAYTPTVGAVLHALTVTKAPLTIMANSATKQYSDPMPMFTAAYSGFVAGDGPASLGGALSFTTAPPANALSPAGSYTIIPGGQSSANYSITYVNGTLTVTQEDADLSYTGDSLVTTSSGSNNSTATVNLAALVQEAADGSLGNTLGGKTVKFSIFKSTNTAMTTADYTVTSTVNGANNTATASISLSADNYSVRVELVANSQYVADVEDAAVTVVIPGTGIATGGWVTDPNGGRGNFGFTVKYVNSGNAQGNSLYIFRFSQ